MLTNLLCLLINQQVIDATLSEFDKSRLAGQQQIRDAAVGSGNFGGGREGAMMGQYNADSLADRAALQGTMLQPRIWSS